MQRSGSTVTLSLGILISLPLSVGEEFFDVFGEHVTFEVDAGTGLIGAERSVFKGMRNDGDREFAVGDAGDGEADAIDGDAAFFD